MDFRFFRQRRAKDTNKILGEERRELDLLRHQQSESTAHTKDSSDRFKLILDASLELANERDTSKLCDKVLEIMQSLCKAEGASLYIADIEDQSLWFSHVKNEKIEMEVHHFKLPLDETSMAGACGYRKKIIHVPDVTKISKSETFKFNQSFDKRSAYKTKSALCVPILKSTEDLVGVIQLINSKRREGFTLEDIEVAKGLSAHIAVSLETALLYQDIERLFEGFIRASVTAIESRDPTTSGHSERVARLTVRLAEEVSACEQATFRSIRYSTADIKQFRYASLLHDFGKIGVPEPVLLKEKKLYPVELREIDLRLRLLRVAHPELEAEFVNIWEEVLRANEPSIVFEQTKSNLLYHVGKTMSVLGESIPLLTNEEWKRLAIAKGSLTEEDRRQIESHVVHTFKFLEKIPWTKALKRVPEIALSHHEKLDGSGYPQGLRGDRIPIESQIMAVADIFDALTAADRPYKKAVPAERAILILKADAADGKINSDLVQLFDQRRVFEVVE